jgi:predicted Fe-S protein YdhL (DUF1289 family)
MDSPCVASCKLNAEKICVGCFRHIDEIVDWNKKTDHAHLEIFAQIAKRKSAYQECESRGLTETVTALTAITQAEWQQAKQRVAQSKK